MFVTHVDFLLHESFSSKHQVKSLEILKELSSQLSLVLHMYEW